MDDQLVETEIGLHIYLYVVYGVNVIGYGWESFVFHAHSPLMKDCIIKKKKKKKKAKNKKKKNKKNQQQTIKLSYHFHVIY